MRCRLFAILGVDTGKREFAGVSHQHGGCEPLWRFRHGGIGGGGRTWGVLAGVVVWAEGEESGMRGVAEGIVRAWGCVGRVVERKDGLWFVGWAG